MKKRTTGHLNKTNRRIGAVLSASTIACQILVSVFFTPYVLSVLGDRDYGIYTFALSITSWLSALLLAMGSGYTKYLSLAKKKSVEAEQMCDGIYFLIFAILSLLILVAGGVTFLLFVLRCVPLNGYSDQEVSNFCFVLGFSVFLCAANSLLGGFKSYLYYRQKFILIYTFELLLIVLQTLITYLVLQNGGDIRDFAFTHITISFSISLILALIPLIFFNERIRLNVTKEEKKERRRLIKEILVFSSFVLVNTTVDTLNQSMDKTILGFINPSDVTLYTLGHNINVYLQGLTNIFVVIYVKELTDRYYGDGGLADADKAQLEIGVIQTLITFLIIGGFAACGMEFVTLWIGEERQTVFWIAVILLLIYSPTYSRGCAVTIRRLEGVHKQAAILYLGGAILNAVLSVALCMILDNDFAIWSCVIGTAVSVIGTSWIGFSIFDVKKAKMNIAPFWKNYVSCFILTGICLGLTLLYYLIPSFKTLSAYVRFIVKGGTYVALFACAVLIFYRKKIVIFWKVRKKKQQEGSVANVDA